MELSEAYAAVYNEGQYGSEAVRQHFKAKADKRTAKLKKNPHHSLHREYPEDLRKSIENVESYIHAWFNERAAKNAGCPNPDNWVKGTCLSDYLRKGARGEDWDAYDTRTSFTKALKEVNPKHVEEFKTLFVKLADKIEQDPSLLDSKKQQLQGNWYEVAKSPGAASPAAAGGYRSTFRP